MAKIKIYFKNSQKMEEVENDSVHLIITSPPYPFIEMWDYLFKDMNFEQCHEYLNKVWKECYRVLIDSGILCINIGDALRKKNDVFQLWENHSKVMENCRKIGFYVLPYVLWKKPSNKPNAFLGSGFLPTNAYITLDCEFILIFRKGNIRKFLPKDKLRYESSFTKEERDKWFSQIWEIRGERQNGFATFPEEIPYRLIRMFSIKDDWILDPFLGSGTTLKVAKQLGRNGIGYEINENYKDTIYEKIGLMQRKLEVIE